MQEYHYTRHDYEASGCPFQGTFEDNPWVAYHGTSTAHATDIERLGIQWSGDVYSYSDIERLITIFDHLHWCGSDMAGFAVLAAFTLKDFRVGGGEVKPTYFSETPDRSLLYASADWAGGETARALRHAFADLERYLTDSITRQRAITEAYKGMRGAFRAAVPPECEIGRKKPSFEQLRALWDHHAGLGIEHGVAGRQGLVPPPPGNVTEWLREQLEPIRGLQQRVLKLLNRFDGGMVYAVRFLPDDLPNLSFDQGGLACAQVLRPDRILAKAKIDPDVEYDIVRSNSNSRRRLDAITRDGVFRRARDSTRT